MRFFACVLPSNNSRKAIPRLKSKEICIKAHSKKCEAVFGIKCATRQKVQAVNCFTSKANRFKATLRGLLSASALHACKVICPGFAQQAVDIGHNDMPQALQNDYAVLPQGGDLTADGFQRQAKIIGHRRARQWQIE